MSTPAARNFDPIDLDDLIAEIHHLIVLDDTEVVLLTRTVMSWVVEGLTSVAITGEDLIDRSLQHGLLPAPEAQDDMIAWLDSHRV